MQMYSVDRYVRGAKRGTVFLQAGVEILTSGDICEEAVVSVLDSGELKGSGTFSGVAILR